MIWNEPNSSTFWRPQFAPDGSSVSAPAYEQLLAQCWDDLARRASVRERDRGERTARERRPRPRPAPSDSPVSLLRGAGDAYRCSGRDRPIFDTVGHNPYPNTSAEPPWTTHPGGTIGEGDYRQARLGADRGVRRHGAAGAGLRALDLVHGGRLPDPRRRGQRSTTSARERPLGARALARPTRSVTGACRASTRRRSSPTPSASPTASRTWAPSSTSCSPTSRCSAAGSPASSGRTGSRSRRTGRSRMSSADIRRGWVDCAAYATG